MVSIKIKALKFLLKSEAVVCKFHGVSKHQFPLYLKEMEFRYNYKE